MWKVSLAIAVEELGALLDVHADLLRGSHAGVRYVGGISVMICGECRPRKAPS
jgi:hypothetical protein